MDWRITRYFEHSGRPMMVNVECPACERPFGLSTSVFADPPENKITCPFCREYLTIDRPRFDPVALVRLTLDTADLFGRYKVRALTSNEALNSVSAHLRDLLEHLGHTRLMSVSNERWGEFLDARAKRAGKPCQTCEGSRVVLDPRRVLAVCPDCV